MSGFGAWFGKAVGGLGGPQLAAILVGGGLLAGAVGGGLVATAAGGLPGGAPGTLSIYPCPDAGPALATVPSGQRFLVTGKTADASWVRIHYPLPGRTEAWVQAGPLEFDGSLGSLPVVACSPLAAGPGASIGPGPTLTAVGNHSPSPPPSSAPPPPPDGGPTLARFTIGKEIAGGPQRYCRSTPRTVTISVRATDPSGVAGVELSYRKPGAAAFATRSMARVGDTDTWRVTLATDGDGITGPGTLRVFVSATDADPTPHTTRVPAKTIAVAECANEGPTLASLRAGPGTVFTNTDACRAKAKTTAITVRATDVDDVASVTLHYRLPGEGSFRDARMTRNGDRWRATVTPVDQWPNADGTASFYVVGEDELGESRRSATRTFRVDRCDFEAVIENQSQPNQAICVSQPGWLYAKASDRDGIDGSSMTLVYTYVRKNGSTKTATKRMDGNNDGDWYYSVSLQAGSNWDLNRTTLTYFFRTTDRYGGTTKGGAGTAIVAGC